MLVSALLVSLIGMAFKAAPALSTLIKIIVDTVLFFISYRIQQGWVFSEKDNAKNRKSKNYPPKPW